MCQDPDGFWYINYACFTISVVLNPPPKEKRDEARPRLERGLLAMFNAKLGNTSTRPLNALKGLNENQQVLVSINVDIARGGTRGHNLHFERAEGPGREPVGWSASTIAPVMSTLALESAGKWGVILLEAKC